MRKACDIFAGLFILRYNSIKGQQMSKNSQTEERQTGKRAKYGTPQEMQKKIDEYFSKYENPLPLTDGKGNVLLDKTGKPIYKEDIPTSSGLAYHLGFNSRCSLHDYAEKPTFTEVMKRAKLRLQTYWEPYLNSKNSNGVRYLFANLNDGWKEPEEARAIADKSPVIAQIVFIDQKGKYAKASEIPVMDAEFEEVKQITPPKAKTPTKAKKTTKKTSKRER